MSFAQILDCSQLGNTLFSRPGDENCSRFFSSIEVRSGLEVALFSSITVTTINVSHVTFLPVNLRGEGERFS